jgi:hypothetical protein
MTLDDLNAERERVLARRNSLVSRVSVGDRTVQYDLAQADKVLADLDRRILVSASKGL